MTLEEIIALLRKYNISFAVQGDCLRIRPYTNPNHYEEYRIFPECKDAIYNIGAITRTLTEVWNTEGILTLTVEAFSMLQVLPSTRRCFERTKEWGLFDNNLKLYPDYSIFTGFAFDWIDKAGEKHTFFWTTSHPLEDDLLYDVRYYDKKMWDCDPLENLLDKICYNKEEERKSYSK